MLEVIGRRKFMRNSLVLASCAVIPAAIGHKPSSDSDALEQLIVAISHQCAINDTSFSEEDMQAMTYAYNKIKPQNHLEYTIVTACSAKYVYDIGLTDEYVRRKNSKTPELFYHPVFDLEKRCSPITHGLLFFREQGIFLLQELISTITPKATAYYWELIRGKFRFDDFAKMVKNEYAAELGMKRLQDIYDFIYTCSPFLPYSWHSTIVSRAGL